MNESQALVNPGAIARGAVVFGLYGGSALITLALVAVSFGDGSLREFAAHGLSGVVDILVNVMSALGAVVRLI